MAKKKIEEKKEERKPPVIAVMGHVDHGKTTLIDYIRKTTIAAKEAGGITQSIRAFHIDYKGNALTFIDTPGHEAFAKMRERGSKLSDIILLVVAADDGVKPQTKEVIQLALADKIPMVVAINKTDLPGADVNRVKGDLAKEGVMLEGWGGDTVSVEVSAKNGTGVDSLLDMLVLVAEIEDQKIDMSKNTAIILESYMQKNVGPESLMIVTAGKLSVGDFVGGSVVYGKIRALIDDTNTRVQEAGISQPVGVLGLEKVLQSGEEVYVAKKREDVLIRKAVVEETQVVSAEEGKSPVELLDELLSKSKETDEKPALQIVLKADVVGSLEAITSSIQNATEDTVDISIIRTGTGEISEEDIMYAKSTKSVVIGFNAPISTRVATLAKHEHVIVMNYSIIYELIDDVMSAAESLIPPEIIEIPIGNANVVEVFALSNGNVVAGSIVADGKIAKGYNCYILRGKERVYEGKITSLRHLKDEIKEAAKGVDCGIGFTPNFPSEKGDTIYCIRIEKS